ncbi:MAG TPA: hypothetical protein VH277_07925 [Gemmatimonadaceae bacterium]|nr:hypothetical protein [Gemmatimonadaceae bacterium]
MLHLHYSLAAVWIAVVLFAGMIGFIEAGRRLGVRQLATVAPDERARSLVGPGVVYALLSLLIGFTFNGAAARFDNRRQLIIQEVSATGTAWQRIDALPEETQAPIRADFRRYVDAVIAPESAPTNHDRVLGTSPAVAQAQHDVWSHTVAICVTPVGERARMLVLPGLNDMFGAVEKERLAREVHPPRMIYAMLAIAAFAGALFVGYGMALAPRRNWLHIIGVSATIAGAAFVIIELEYPRLGLIRVDSMDRALVELRASMN